MRTVFGWPIYSSVQALDPGYAGKTRGALFASRARPYLLRRLL